MLRRIGVEDEFIQSGGIAELLAHYRMRPEDIAIAAREATQMRDAHMKESSNAATTRGARS